MAAKCVNSVLDKVVTSIEKTTKKVDEVVFNDTFIDAINKSTKSINRINCSDAIVDYFSDKSGVDYKGAYKWWVDNANLNSIMTALGSTLDKYSPNIIGKQNSVGSVLCISIDTATKILYQILDGIAKMVLNLYTKIDRFLKKIELAISDFIDSIQSCILQVIINAKLAINKLISSTLNFDSVLDLMRSCPCITDIMSSLFNCKDEESPDNQRPEVVYKCIVDKYNLDAASIIGAVNKFVDDIIISNINRGFAIVKEAVKMMMEALITPIRELTKLWCKMLSKEYPIDYLIKLMGPAKCLLVYKKRYSEDGSVSYKMNVFDILNSLKLMSGCLDKVCSKYTDSIKLKVQEYNETFRLDASYWDNPYIVDIYTSCLIVDMQRKSTRATIIREVYLKNNKNKNAFISIIDTANDVGSIIIESTEDARDIGRVYESIKQKDGDEEEFPKNQGELKFYTGVENNIITMLNNMVSSYDREPYYELSNLLVNYTTKFNKNQKHLNAIDNAKKTYRSEIIPDNKQLVLVSDSLVENDILFNSNEPTYIVPSDYDTIVIENINNSTAPNRNKNETTVDYYSKWFNSLVV